MLLSKKGLALPKTHGLSTAISRHKARLTAELTKARLRRGFASLNSLRAHVDGQPARANGEQAAAGPAALYPRWIRVNTLRTSLDDQLKTSFAYYARTAILEAVVSASGRSKLLYVDENISDLIAIPPHTDIINDPGYKEGKLILQDKASCFPAALLDPGPVGGDIIDACAAPGNKTTHLAAIVASHERKSGHSTSYRRIFACERDALRSQTLSKMIKVAGAEHAIHVKPKQDFMKLDPQSREFANVTCLLLDPSCSGSGIVGRDEVALEIHLPNVSQNDDKAPKGKKRKRKDGLDELKPEGEAPAKIEGEEKPTLLDDGDPKLQARLSALSSFQLRLLQHAMAFPAAQRITYSTCSIYSEENEHVVVKALLSDISLERGWRAFPRHQQIEGLKNWNKRGQVHAVADILDDGDLKGGCLHPQIIADACIRCEKNTEDGTMGFFVAGFIRDLELANDRLMPSTSSSNGVDRNGVSREVSESFSSEAEEEWSGFSDEEK